MLEEENKKKKKKEEEITVNDKVVSASEFESLKEQKDIKLKEISKNNFKTILYG